MTNSEQALREKAINIFADIFTAGGEAHEVGGQSFDQLQQSGYIDRKLSDLTALISEHYYPKEKYDELLQQRDELKELLKAFTEGMRRYWKDTYQEETPDLALVIEAEAAIKKTER